MKYSNIIATLTFLLAGYSVSAINQYHDKKIKLQIEVQKEDKLLAPYNLKKEKRISHNGQVIDIKLFEKLHKNVLERAFLVEKVDETNDLDEEKEELVSLRKSKGTKSNDESETDDESSILDSEEDEQNTEEENGIKIISTEESKENDIHMMRKLFKAHKGKKEITYCYMVFTFSMDLEKMNEMNRSELIKSLDSMADYTDFMKRSALTETEAILESEYSHMSNSNEGSSNETNFSAAELMNDTDNYKIDISKHIRSFDDIINHIVSHSVEEFPNKSLYNKLINERELLYKMELNKESMENVTDRFLDNKQKMEKFFLYEAISNLKTVYFDELEQNKNNEQYSAEEHYAKFLDLLEKAFECHVVLDSVAILDFFILERVNEVTDDDISMKENKSDRIVIRKCVNFYKILIDNTGFNTNGTMENKSALRSKEESKWGTLKKGLANKSIKNLNDETKDLKFAGSDVEDDLYKENEIQYEDELLEDETKLNTKDNSASKKDLTDAIKDTIVLLSNANKNNKKSKEKDITQKEMSKLEEEDSTGMVDDEYDFLSNGLDETNNGLYNDKKDMDEDLLDEIDTSSDETPKKNESMDIEDVKISDMTEKENENNIISILDFEGKKVLRNNLSDIANEMSENAEIDISYIENENAAENLLDDSFGNDDEDDSFGSDNEFDDDAFSNDDSDETEEDAEPEESIDEEEEDEVADENPFSMKGFKSIIKSHAKKGLQKLVDTGSDIAKDTFHGLLTEAKGAAKKLVKGATSKIKNKLNKSKGRKNNTASRSNKRVNKSIKKAAPATRKSNNNNKNRITNKKTGNNRSSKTNHKATIKKHTEKKLSSAQPKRNNGKKQRKSPKKASFISLGRKTRTSLSVNKKILKEAQNILSNYEELKEKKHQLINDLSTPTVSDSKIIKSLEDYLAKEDKNDN